MGCVNSQYERRCKILSPPKCRTKGAKNATAYLVMVRQRNTFNRSNEGGDRGGFPSSLLSEKTYPRDQIFPALSPAIEVLFPGHVWVAQETRFTVLVYLSSCQGGETVFERNVSFSPRAGSILFHIHGDQCLLHEAKAVESGIKYVLRTDLVYSA